MIAIRQKLQQLVNTIEAERGPFTLFGVFMREDSPGRWDLVLSAPWLERGRLKALGQFVGLLEKAVGKEQVMSFSRIVTLNQDDRALDAIREAVGTAKPPLEKDGHNLFGLPIERAYILRVKPHRPRPKKRKQRTAAYKSERVR